MVLKSLNNYRSNSRLALIQEELLTEHSTRVCETDLAYIDGNLFLPTGNGDLLLRRSRQIEALDYVLSGSAANHTQLTRRIDKASVSREAVDNFVHSPISPYHHDELSSMFNSRARRESRPNDQ